MTHIIGYGSPDPSLVDQAIGNFSGAAFANLSFCTTPVELLSLDGRDTVVRHATGFFWRHAGVDFVVTNWHVVSGRYAFTGDLLDPQTGFVPRKIRVHGWRLAAAGGSNIELLRPGWTVDLSDHGVELFGEPPRIEGRVVDIAAIPLPPDFAMDRRDIPPGSHGFNDVEPCVNLRTQDRIASQAGDECVLLGYPLRQYSGLLLPIWKRGSLATDTNMTVDGSPAFLVDAATSPAMSGSPIFRRISGAVQVDPSSQMVSEMRGFEFLGVYAGRLQSADLAQINVGYGWLGNQVEPAVAQSWLRWKTVMDRLANGQSSPAG